MLHYSCVSCTILHYAMPFHATLHHLCVRCTNRHYAEPFHATLHCLYVRCTIRHYAGPFHATLHRLCLRCATRHYPEPFDVTLRRLCIVLQMSARLFAIELVLFTISCSNSTRATRPFIIWLNYSCLGCSVSWRKTKPSIIWPCHFFISFAVLQPILRPAVYLLIFLTSLYFWFASCKVIQDSIRFWIPRCGFRIPDAGFQILPLQIPDSKTQKILDFSFWFAPNFRISFSRNDFDGGFRYWRTCLWMHVCLFIFPQQHLIFMTNV